MTTSDVSGSDSSGISQDVHVDKVDSADPNTTAVAIPVLQQNPSSPEVALVGSAPVAEDAEILRKQFKLDSSIPPEHREKIFQKCLEEYRKSIAEFEKIAGEVGFDHPDAKAFADALCKRLAAIVDACNEIFVEEAQSDLSVVKPLELLNKEFMRAIRITQFFGNESTNPGSVGMNALAIQKAIKGGNLREQMTLVYKTIFSFLINEVLDKPGMIDKVNEKLAELPAEQRFQIDKDLYEREKQNGTGVIDTPLGKMVKQIPLVADFRNVEKGRVMKAKPSAGSAPVGPKLTEVQALSDREARAGTECRSREVRLRWISGRNWMSVSPDCSFAKQAKALGDLPLVTGPSGTTDGILHLSEYLGLGAQKEAGVLACAAWMISTDDHSLHEIRTAADAYGIAYSGLPEDFATFHSTDPAVVKAIDQRLEQRGLKNPSLCFTPEVQKTVALDLAPTAAVDAQQPAASVPAVPVNDFQAEIATILDGVQVGIDVADLRGLNEPAPVLAQIKQFNVQLRTIEAAMIRLGAYRDSNLDNKPLVAAIRAKSQELFQQYNALIDQKIAYVQAHVTPIHRVYAMGVSRVLPAGTDIYTANGRPKVEKILYTQGFSVCTDPGKPATCFAPGFVIDGAFGANELGEQGHYFAVGSPAYLRDGTLGVHFSMIHDQEGVAIMSVTELKARGFTDEQIEAGYKRIHANYPYLQNDGLPPKDTEVVFLRSGGNLRVVEMLEGSDSRTITMRMPREEYERVVGGLDDDEPIRPLHASWNPAPAMQMQDPGQYALPQSQRAADQLIQVQSS